VGALRRACSFDFGIVPALRRAAAKPHTPTHNVGKLQVNCDQHAHFVAIVPQRRVDQNPQNILAFAHNLSVENLPCDVSI
jgi:hypothetical protein